MSKHPARQAEPGTEISFTRADGTARTLIANAEGRVVIHDDEDEAQAVDLPIFEEKPAAPAKGGS
jgi:hypothetical protein